MKDHDTSFHHNVGRMEHRIRKVLHILELAIASVTIVVLVIGLAMNIWKVAGDPTAFSNTTEFLHAVLNIVVGLEFVRMLIDMTPANTLEVLIVAIARQVIISHDDPISNVCCVLCIAGLFATRHFLIPKNEMTIEISEVASDEESANTH